MSGENPGGIFATYAPHFWAHGLPVIPLMPRDKRPSINQWSVFGSQMPTPMVQQHWLASFPNGNIGLPFGPASGLCGIDIDTEDEALIAAIEEILPKTPYVRVGQKGKLLVYRWTGGKNFKLRGADGGMILEHLGLGNQAVMNPSIHPKTQQPYVATANLWEVLADIPEIPVDIEDKMRALLGVKGFDLGAGGRTGPLDVIPAGERDIQMVRHAGYLARVVMGIDKSQSFSLFEAIQHMHHWVEAFTAKVAGDAMDPDKGVAKLLEFLVKDLEKGRTLPHGWDANMPGEWQEHPTIKLMSEKNAQQRWTVVRAREWLSSKIAEKASDDDWAMERIEELVAAVAADEHFTEFNMRTLIGYILTLCGNLPLKKTDLLQLWKQAKKGTDAEWEDHQTIAASVLEDMQRMGEIRYDHGQFWQWSGSCFQKLDEDVIYLHIANNVKGSAIVRRHSDYSAVVNVLRRICRGQLIQAEDRGINFANGFVGEDLVVADHDPKFGATFTLPFNYDRDLASKPVRWFEFLASCWGHEKDFAERMMALQEMFAVTLFKAATQYQRAFLLFGRAGTGKTQILQVLRAMLPPDAIAELNPAQWGGRFNLTDLIGKAANICGELPENGTITGNVFKEVVEGSPVRSEFKNQDGFVFVPLCAHWFASNYLPMSKDTTRGFIRRWLILDFNKPVRAEDRIENLAEIIVAEERDAIAAWALEGLRRVLDQRGFTEPACHERRMGQMRRINNSVHAFLEDSTGYSLGDGTAACRELYDAYSFHMRDVGRGQPVSFERFMQMLEDLDMDVVRDAIGDYVVEGIVKRDLKVAA